MLDTTILGHTQLILFCISFIGVYIALSIIKKYRLAHQSSGLVSAYFGGIAIVVACTVLSLLVLKNNLLQLGLITIAALTISLGTRDEIKKQSPGWQLIAQLGIALSAVLSGWTIRYVTNPAAAGVLNLQSFSLGIFHIPGDLLTIIWIVLLMNAINWLDGIDGLAPSVSSVAFTFLAIISLLPQIYDQQTLTLAIIGAAATSAFAIWNWSPAKIFLGTTGSWFIGVFIGMVAISSGGKVVTTTLILALPVIDLVAVSLQRLAKKQPPWHGDRVHHLHYRLKQSGLTDTQITLLGIGLTTIFGLAALTLQTTGKLVLLTTGVLMVILIVAASRMRQHFQP